MERCSEQFDFIFADPPYALPQLGEIPSLVFSHGLLKEGGIFVLEHGKDYNFESDPPLYGTPSLRQCELHLLQSSGDSRRTTDSLNFSPNGRSRHSFRRTGRLSRWSSRKRSLTYHAVCSS